MTEFQFHIAAFVWLWVVVVAVAEWREQRLLTETAI